MKTVHNL